MHIPNTERDSKILALYRDGKMMKEISAAVGMAPNSIVGVLRKLGVERPTKPQKRWRDREDQTAQILALWNDGLCCSQISERLNLNQKLVDNALTKAKVRAGKSSRYRYDQAAVGGTGRSGFAAAMARKT